MAEIIHLRCRYCGEPMKKSPEPYCGPCNLYLCYRAMPLLLGMMMTGDLPIELARLAGPAENREPFQTYQYAHTRYILD